VRISGTFRADNSLLLIDAMRRGAGLGPPRPLFAVYPTRDHPMLKVHAQVTFLKQQLPPLTPSVPSAAPP
jgi:hypothetical protein